MNDLDHKLLGLGREIWNRISDLALMPAGDTAYSRKTVTYRGGSVEIIVARKEVADVMEEAAVARFAVADVPGTTETKQ